MGALDGCTWGHWMGIHRGIVWVCIGALDGCVCAWMALDGCVCMEGIGWVCVHGGH